MIKHFKPKRLLVFTALFSTAFVILCGVNNRIRQREESISVEKETNSQVLADEESINLYILPEILLETTSSFKDVLTDKCQFHYVGTNENVFLSHFLDSKPDYHQEILAFSILDMDSDGCPELILLYGVENSESSYATLILRNLQNGSIDGYSIGSRTFVPHSLKIDGSFHFSAGAGNYGYGKMNFAPDQFIIDEIMRCDYNDVRGQFVPFYYLDGKPTTQGEFQTAVDIQESKANAIWYVYNEANFEAICKNE